MSIVFADVIRYINAWLLIAFVFFFSMMLEKVYVTLTGMAAKRVGFTFSMATPKSIKEIMTMRITLPEKSNKLLALYMPCFAAAALATVCASLPYCTFVPIIGNGADFVQLTFFILLSDVFVIISLYSIWSQEVVKIAVYELISTLRILVAFVACCASIAASFTQGSMESDPLSLNLFSAVEQFRSMSAVGAVGTLLFVFLLLSQIPCRTIGNGTYLFISDEIPQFSGIPRAILELCSAMRSLLIISFVVYVFFPSNLFENLGDGFGATWGAQALNFIFFWFVVAVVRLILVPLCQLSVRFTERHLPAKIRYCFVPAVTVILMAMLWYEGMLFSQEVGAY
ncbi:MAG: hypothetical protein Q4E17_04870 [Synergistes sp.]|nr:hypothetical protein [Synergistes sp.]